MNQNTMPRRKQLKKLLLKLQNESECSTAKLAQKIGVSKQIFSNWMQCRINPEPPHLEAIAKAANLSLDDFIAYLEDKPEPSQETGLGKLLE